MDLTFTLRELDRARDPAGLEIRLGDTVLTRLLRHDSSAENTELHIPPGPLGIWFAENWWRLRWECLPLDGLTPEWREAHDMASIGAGHAWPSIAFWGEGQRVMVLAKADPPGVMGPVRFLQDALSFVPGQSFETAVDALIKSVDGMLVGEDRDYFRSLIGALNEERNDADVSAWRRLEAINGFDPDEAPESLISGLLHLSERFGNADVEEAAAAHPGVESVNIINRLIKNSASDKRFVEVDFADAVRGVGSILPRAGREPWSLAESAASRLRQALDVGKGPLINSRLAELAQTARSILKPQQQADDVAPYGVRLASEVGQRVLLRAHWLRDRRFELMRALGDAIWSGISPLGPLSRAGTERQKFQHAFAANMLCPISALKNYLGDDDPNVDPSDEDISAAARHFHVSERVARSVLINKRMSDRAMIDVPANIAPSGTNFQDIAGPRVKL